MAKSKFKVGDYVQQSSTGAVGIVYEVNFLSYRIQQADGTKVRNVLPGILVAAPVEAIKQYQSAAVEGMNPEAIIAREQKEGHGAFLTSPEENEKWLTSTDEAEGDDEEDE